MHTRTLNYVIGASALLTLGSSLAFAQAKPTSTRRIPISKEGPAPVTRVDTVTVYKTDTLRIQGPTVTHTDTIRLTNTVTRVDTVAPPPAPVRIPDGFFIGVGAGVNLPEGSIYIPNGPGPVYQIQLGWQGADQLLGIRLDGQYSKLGEDSQFSGYQADPDIINGNLDLKLNLPWFHHLFGRRPYFTIYGLGGGSWVRYKNLPIVLDPGAPNPGTVHVAQFPNVLLGDYSAVNKFGWNAGGGASVAFGRTEIFAESRLIQWTRDNASAMRQVPIVLGVNWYGHSK